MAEVDRQIARVAARQYGVMSIARLRALGLSTSQIKRRVGDGRLHPVHRGVYAVGHRTLTPRGHWLAAVLAVGPGAVLSHGDAAALWGIASSSGGLIHVTTPNANRPRRGLLVHRARTLRPEDRGLVDRIPVTSVARTLLDMAATRPRPQLKRTYEQAERMRLLDVRAIETSLSRSNGHRGVGPLRALLDYDPAPAAEAASELERMFLDVVRAADLPPPRVNVLVEGYLVDAHWPAAGLVVELDGYEHHGNRAAFERDHGKALHLQLAGLRLLAFTYRQVTERPSLVAEAVAAELRRAHPPPGPAARR